MLPQYTETIQKFKLWKEKQKENDNEKYNISRNLQILAVLDPQSYPAHRKNANMKISTKKSIKKITTKLFFSFI